MGAHFDSVSCADGVRQRAGRDERLSRENSPVGDQLFHSVASGCRHHGGRPCDAARRLRRGMHAMHAVQRLDST